jgi:LemA protein
MVAVILVAAAIAIILVGGVLAYNSTVRKRNRVQEAWSQIDVELKRRHNLIPNLVETVRGYAAHERGTLDEVTAARAAAVTAGATQEAGKAAPAENRLNQALRSMFAVAEGYPQLRAVESFRQLQEELTATEDKIEYARRYYNGSVRDYNITLQTFPRNLLATAFKFRGASYFEADQDDQAGPGIDFAGLASTPVPHAPAAPAVPAGSSASQPGPDSLDRL